MDQHFTTDRHWESRESGMTYMQILAVPYDKYVELDPDKYSGLHFASQWPRLYFTKYRGWSYENEAQLIASLSGGAPLRVPIETSLDSVLIGEGASQSDVDQLRTIALRFSATT